MGPARINEILVVEGDKVKKGQIVAKLESVQAAADVAAQRAAVGSSEAESSASEAGLRAADETITTAQATLEQDESRCSSARASTLSAPRNFGMRSLSRGRSTTRGAARWLPPRRRVKEAQARVDTGKGAPTADRRAIKCTTATGKSGPG